MSEHFIINGLAGKKTLEGEIAIVGAKNAALKAIAASVLFNTPLRLTNVPHIEDVSRILDMLTQMGGSAILAEHQVKIDASCLTTTMLTPEIAMRIRASVVLTGPILARYGRVQFPHPGGDVIGERPIDLFIEGYLKMGAKVTRKGIMYDIKAPKGGLRGAEIFFRNISVTGTESFIMAAILAKGTTVIRNAAMEPEIIWLADILNKSGAHISGAGTPIITVRGSKLLSQTKGAFRVIPDRIEAGSFIILGALAAKKLTVRGIIPEHLESLIELLEYTGTKLVRGKDYITISQSKTKTPKLLRPVSMRTHEYPGFPTDLQSPMMIYLTQIAGESFVFETIFEGRLNYTESLNRMGANITMMDPHRVLVKGASQLKGSVLESPDIRAGLAFVIAGAIASGTSEIHNVYHIDRGYEDIEKRLCGIGLDIVRIGE